MRVGAPGCTFLAGEESAAGAPASSWLRWPRALGAGGGAWPGCGALPVIGLLCCNFSRALRGARTRPAPLLRESLCFLGPPGGDQVRFGGLCLGDSSAVASRRKPATRGPALIVPVSAQWPQLAHVGSGRRQTTPRPWLPDKAVLEGAARLLSAFLRGT